MSYLNLHLQDQIRHKLQEANEILNEYQKLTAKERKLNGIETSINQLCQTLENDTVSSIGSKGSKGSGESNGKREQATSMSFMNIPGPSAKSARSPVTTRSRAASKMSAPKPSGEDFPELKLESNDEYQAANLKDRARSVTGALQDLIDVAEKSGAESEYTKIIKEPFDITGVPSEITERPRKRRFRATRSNLDLAVDTIKGFLVGFFRWLANNPLVNRYVNSLWFDATMFLIMVLLILHFVPCNKIPGLKFVNPYAKY